MSNIVLDTLTFVGEGLTNGVSNFWNRTAGLMNGFRRLTNRVNSDGKYAHVLWRLTLPELLTADTSCGCSGELAYSPAIAEISIRMDAKAPPAHRALVAKAVKDLAATVQFKDSVETPAVQP